MYRFMVRFTQYTWARDSNAFDSSHVKMYVFIKDQYDRYLSFGNLIFHSPYETQTQLITNEIASFSAVCSIKSVYAVVLLLFIINKLFFLLHFMKKRHRYYLYDELTQIISSVFPAQGPPPHQDDIKFIYDEWYFFSVFAIKILWIEMMNLSAILIER